MENTLIGVEVFAVAEVWSVEDGEMKFVPGAEFFSEDQEESFQGTEENQEEETGEDDEPEPRAAIVLLRTADDLYLPIFIGEQEALSVCWFFNSVKFDRPMTYDFLANILKGLDVSVIRVVIYSTENEVFLAFVELKKAGKQGLPEVFVRVDARPSDAINLAIRLGAPIFVSQEILDQYAKDSSMLEVCGIQEADCEEFEQDSELPPSPDDDSDFSGSLN